MKNFFLTAYTDLLHTTARLTVLGARERACTDYVSPMRGASVSTVDVDFLSMQRAYELAHDDYDAMPEDKIPALAATAIQWLQRSVAVRDHGTAWATANQAEQAIMAKFGDLLGAPDQRFQDPNDDDAFAWFCSQSVIAHRLTRVDGGYRIDLSFLRGYELRDGAEALGSDAYFDDALRPLRIEGFRGATIRPGDADWGMAKYHFRCSAALAATIVDHAIYAHLATANSMVVSTRRMLDVDHPLRRLLAPFQLKTIGINELASVTLIGEGAMVHRLTGLTWRGLDALYHDAERQARFETLPELVARNGTAHLPWAQDAIEIWNALEHFASRYLALYMDEELSDPSVLAWWRSFASRFGSPMTEIRTRTELARVVTIMMWVVTGWHRHIAIPDDLARSPEWFAYYLPAGTQSVRAMWPSREKTMLNMLLVALTSPRGPKITQDFSQYMLDAPARACVKTLHAELSAAGARIAERNLARAYPLRVFEPQSIEISIST